MNKAKDIQEGNETEIFDNNALIKEFIKDEGYPTEGYNVYELQYHESFDWLMPVVEKIRRLRDTTLTDKTNGLAYSTITVYFTANGYALGGDKRKYSASLLGSLVYQRMINDYQHTFDKIEVPHITKYGETPIKPLYEVIVEFIKWYNQNKTS